MQRRQFLQLGMASAAVLSSSSAKPAAAAAAPAQDGWDPVRAQFNLDPTYLHFAGFLLASHPAPVRAAIARHRDALDANPADYVHGHLGLDDATREAAARYLHGTANDIALTDSTTMGLGILYNGLTLRPGQEILSSTHEHYSTQRALQQRTSRLGTPVRRISLYDRPEAADPEAMTAALVRAIRPETRVVALTWVHSSTGVKLPIAKMAAALRGSNVLFCVDGVHALGVETIDVGQLGCDFLVAGCHKWLFGPRGTGLVWGRGAAWEHVDPLFASFDWPSYVAWMEGRPSTAPRAIQVTPGGFHSFEHRWALSTAFDFHQELGPRRVTARIHELASHLKDGIAGMNHLRLITPRSPEVSAGFVMFNHASLTPREVVERLAAQRIVATTTPYLPTYARLAPGVLNTLDEVQTVLAALDRLDARPS